VPSVRHSGDEPVVDFEHPANRGILAYLSNPDRLGRSVSVARSRRSCSPDDIAQPYWSLGAHPDLLQRLWDELGRVLPEDCRWVVLGTPVLVRPRSGVIFAFGGGTQTYALRLPASARAVALAAGGETVRRYPGYAKLDVSASTLDLGAIGEEWVFGNWRKGEEEWCRAAYDAAGVRAEH
jgi:hypothetical protein